MLLPTAPKFQDLKLTCIKWIYSRFWDPGTDSINNYQVRFLVGQGNGKRFWFLILSSNTMLLPTAPKFQDLKSTCIKCIFPDPGTAFWRILEPIVLILPGQIFSEPEQREEILIPDSFFEYHASPNRAKVPRPEIYLHKVDFSGSWNCILMDPGTDSINTTRSDS
jgi:hypothetical protein